MNSAPLKCKRRKITGWLHRLPIPLHKFPVALHMTLTRDIRCNQEDCRRFFPRKSAGRCYVLIVRVSETSATYAAFELLRAAYRLRCVIRTLTVLHSVLATCANLTLLLFSISHITRFSLSQRRPSVLSTIETVGD